MESLLKLKSSGLAVAWNALGPKFQNWHFSFTFAKLGALFNYCTFHVLVQFFIGSKLRTENNTLNYDFQTQYCFRANWTRRERGLNSSKLKRKPWAKNWSVLLQRIQVLLTYYGGPFLQETKLVFFGQLTHRAEKLHKNTL